jgi:hypothetical protein
MLRLMRKLEPEQEGAELVLPPRTIDPPPDFDLFDPGDLDMPGSHPRRT